MGEQVTKQSRSGSDPKSAKPDNKAECHPEPFVSELPPLGREAAGDIPVPLPLDSGPTDFILPSRSPKKIDPAETQQALKSLALDEKQVNEQLRVTNSYGQHAESFLQMTRLVFPKLSMSPETRAKLIEAIDLEPWAKPGEPKYHVRANLNEARSAKLTDLTRSQFEFAKEVAEVQNRYDTFINRWYVAERDTVRQQLYAELNKLSPEFSRPFTSPADIAQAGSRLGNEVAQYQLRATPPKTIRDLMSTFRGQGGFEVDQKPPNEHAISIGVLNPEDFKNSKDSTTKQMAEAMSEINVPGTLGQALTHEQIHNLTGYPTSNANHMLFQTPEHAVEIPTVLYDLLMITDSYHDWRKEQSPDYHYRANPTGIVLDLPHGKLNVDFLYQEAKDRFKVLDKDGVGKFLELLSHQESGQFLNNLIWGETRPPVIAEQDRGKIVR